MPDARFFEITYVFRFATGASIQVPARLDPVTLSLVTDNHSQPPEWARLESVGCSECPLVEASTHFCPLAANLAALVQEFAGHDSYEKVHLIVTTPERIISADTTLQAALSSLTGIIMVSSGCPTMDKLRPMVRFHLPLATEQETVYRAASMYLVAQFLRAQAGATPEWSMSGLEAIYHDVHRVNLAMAKCIRKAASRDANANALVRLDLFTEGVSRSTQEALKGLRYLFAASYLREPLGPVDEEHKPVVELTGAKSQAPSQDPVFDRRAFLGRLMDDEDLAKQIVATFLDEIPNQIRALHRNVAEGDAASAGARAHTIKGTAANVGGMALSAVAYAMEKEGKAGHLSQVAALTPELDRQFELLRIAMQESAP